MSIIVAYAAAMDVAAGQLEAQVEMAGSRTAYRADIDGLRAIAVASVVLFHAGTGWVPGGFAGVDMFFVISGYLIGGIVQDDVTAGRFGFAAFYARRARRILPALVTVAIATLTAGMMILGPGELERFAVSAAAALIGLANLWFFHTTDYFTSEAGLEPFLMTWSLGIEEQFYILLPPLLLLVARWPMRRALWAVLALSGASLLLSLLATPVQPIASFYLLPTRAWELGIGVALALAYRAGFRLRPAVQRWAGAVGLAAVAATLLLLDEQTRFPGYAALLPTLATALLIGAPDSGINRRLLASRPMVAIGLISYSWYLWHWPPLALLRIAAAGPVPVPLSLAIALGSIVPAYCCWRWVELPWRRPRRARSDAATLRRYGVALAASLALFGGVAMLRGLPSRAGASAAGIERLLAASHSPCLTGYGVERPAATPLCAPSASEPLVALIGDSHAAALGDALRAEARGHGYRVVQMTAASCPPLLGATPRLVEHPGAARACAAFNVAAIDRAADDPRVRAVILTGFWQAPFSAHALAIGDGLIAANETRADRSSAAALRGALGRTLRRLRGAGKGVLVLGDVPWLRFDPARHVWARALPWRGAIERVASPGLAGADDLVDARFFDPLADQGNRIVAAGAAAAPGVRYVALRAVLCPDGRCRTGAGGLPFFIDEQHLSRAGADYAVRRLAPHLWR